MRLFFVLIFGVLLGAAGARVSVLRPAPVPRQAAPPLEVAVRHSSVLPPGVWDCYQAGNRPEEAKYERIVIP